MKHNQHIIDMTKRLEDNNFAQTIRSGLMMIIPVLMVGAFALIGRSFPIAGYQAFINNFLSGAIYHIFNIAFACTFGMLSVYMTAALSISYQRQRGQSVLEGASATLAALACFFVLAGVADADFSLDHIGTKGMIVAIIAGYLATALYFFFSKLLKRNRRVYSGGDDLRFNNAVSAIIPAALTVLCFAILNYLMTPLFGVTTFQALITKGLTLFFENLSHDFSSGLLFVLISSLLWFFGVHGSDCLEPVMDIIFTPAIQTNITAIQSGGAPTEILTKQFFDCFVLMGGCGAAMCLLLALLIFGRQKSHRGLSRLAAFPMIFNINEVMIFGLPVIFNPIMFIPFILTPLWCYISSYIAMATGMVGLTVTAIDWTTPVVLSGYLVTQSLGGALLQVFNLAVGVAIYAPFVKILDRQNMMSAANQFEKLCVYYKELEKAGAQDVVLTDMNNSLSPVAKALAVDLQEALEQEQIVLYYQPQYDHGGTCIGAEALLRWDHPSFGMIYPPLVIKLAEESGRLLALEQAMITRAVRESAEVREALGDQAEISVNVTGQTLSSPGFITFLSELLAAYAPQGDPHICLEVTEQTALDMTDRVHEVLTLIKNMGVHMAIDDFSMGQTSVNYLKNKYFDFVKLDGSLVREMLHNPRCLDIISAIVEMSRLLDFTVLAEYVESEEQRQALAGVGCFNYQGYLYSPALEPQKLHGFHP